MKSVRLSDFAEGIKDAISDYKGAYREETPEGTLEFALDYSEETQPSYTGVEHLGARECYRIPKYVVVEEVNLYTPKREVVPMDFIQDCQFNPIEIYG